MLNLSKKQKEQKLNSANAAGGIVQKKFSPAEIRVQKGILFENCLSAVHLIPLDAMLD